MGLKVNNANVTKADIMASNGVIQIIDTGVLPNQEPGVCRHEVPEHRGFVILGRARSPREPTGGPHSTIVKGGEHMTNRTRSRGPTCAC
jgi:hypothetical protein